MGPARTALRELVQLPVTTAAALVGSLVRAAATGSGVEGERHGDELGVGVLGEGVGFARGLEAMLAVEAEGGGVGGHDAEGQAIDFVVGSRPIDRGGEHQGVVGGGDARDAVACLLDHQTRVFRGEGGGDLGSWSEDDAGLHDELLLVRDELIGVVRLGVCDGDFHGGLCCD